MTAAFALSSLAAAVAAAMMLAPFDPAEAGQRVGTGTAKADAPKSQPIIRDHRQRTAPGTPLSRRCTIYAGQRVCTSTW